MLWTGWLLMIAGVIVAAVFLPGTSNGGRLQGLASGGSYRWHDDLVGVGFGITVLGAALLVISQLKRWKTDGSS
jgi:hypothetical protein